MAFVFLYSVKGDKKLIIITVTKWRKSYLEIITTFCTHELVMDLLDIKQLITLILAADYH